MLDWQGPYRDNLSDTIFVLDGKEVGKGTVGYQAVCAAIDSWPRALLYGVKGNILRWAGHSTKKPPVSLSLLPDHVLCLETRIKTESVTHHLYVTRLLRINRPTLSSSLASYSFSTELSTGCVLTSIEVREVRKGSVKVGDKISIRSLYPINYCLPVAEQKEAINKQYLFYILQADKEYWYDCGFEDAP